MPVKLSQIYVNPKNPRIIKDDRFKKLVNSIKDFPKMMALRPIITDDKGMILGGNMRYKALQSAGYKEIPDEWVKKASDLTEDEKQRFIIEDNVGFGDWDEDVLSEDYSLEDLQDWGVELNIEEDKKEKNKDLSDNLKSEYIVEIVFGSEEKQEEFYEKMTIEGYKCRILSL